MRRLLTGVVTSIIFDRNPFNWTALMWMKRDTRSRRKVVETGTSDKNSLESAGRKEGTTLPGEGDDK